MKHWWKWRWGVPELLLWLLVDILHCGLLPPASCRGPAPDHILLLLVCPHSHSRFASSFLARLAYCFSASDRDSLQLLWVWDTKSLKWEWETRLWCWERDETQSELRVRMWDEIDCFPKKMKKKPSDLLP